VAKFFGNLDEKILDLCQNFLISRTGRNSSIFTRKTRAANRSYPPPECGYFRKQSGCRRPVKSVSDQLKNPEHPKMLRVLSVKQQLESNESN